MSKSLMQIRLLALSILAICLFSSDFAAAQQSKTEKPSPQPESNRQTSQREGAANEIQWQEFVTQEHGFRVLFPSLPETSVNELPLTKARKAVFAAYSAASNLGMCAVYFSENPVDYESKTLKERYDEWREKHIGKFSYQLTREKDFHFDTQLGREFEYDGMIKGVAIRYISRVVYANKRFYEFTFSFRRQGLELKGNAALLSKIEAQAAVFLDSAQLTAARNDASESATNNRKIPPNLAGEVINGFYRNPFLGFEFNVLSNWRQLDQRGVGELLNFGTEYFGEGNPDTKEQIENSINQTHVLYASRKNTDAHNAKIGLMMLNVLKQPNPRVTKEQVVEASIKVLTAQPSIKLLEKPLTKKLGDLAVMSFKLELSFRGMSAQEKVYVTTLKGYSMEIGVIYQDDETFKEVEQALESLRLIK